MHVVVFLWSGGDVREQGGMCGLSQRWHVTGMLLKDTSSSGNMGD